MKIKTENSYTLVRYVKKIKRIDCEKCEKRG